MKNSTKLLFCFFKICLSFFYYITLNIDRTVRSIKIDKTTEGTLILFSGFTKYSRILQAIGIKFLILSYLRISQVCYY